MTNRIADAYVELKSPPAQTTAVYKIQPKIRSFYTIEDKQAPRPDPIPVEKLVWCESEYVTKVEDSHVGTAVWTRETKTADFTVWLNALRLTDDAKAESYSHLERALADDAISAFKLYFYDEDILP